MKPSDQWKQINEKQFWKHLPKDYRSVTPTIREELEDLSQLEYVQWTLTASEMRWLEQFQSVNNDYGSLDKKIAALLTKLSADPIERYVLEPIKPPRLVDEPIIRRFHISIPRAILIRVGNQSFYGDRLKPNAALRLLIANREELSRIYYFKSLQTKKPISYLRNKGVMQND